MHRYIILCGVIHVLVFLFFVFSFLYIAIHQTWIRIYNYSFIIGTHIAIHIYIILSYIIHSMYNSLSHISRCVE